MVSDCTLTAFILCPFSLLTPLCPLNLTSWPGMSPLPRRLDQGTKSARRVEQRGGNIEQGKAQDDQQGPGPSNTRTLAQPPIVEEPVR